MTDAQIIEALDDEQAMTLTIFGEARGEQIEGKLAVASVILNRLAKPQRYAPTVKDVCLQPKQFSCWNGGDANYEAILAMAQRLLSHLLGADLDGKSLAECQYLSHGILQAILKPRVYEATHYLTRDLYYSTHRPNWATGNPVFIGNHVFLSAA